MDRDELNKLSKRIIGTAIEVHKNLGPGFIEKIYQTALEYEFRKNGFNYKREREIDIQYKEILIGHQRIDFLVADALILELKCVSEINDIHLAQLLSYLKAADVRLGLILNFAKPSIEIKRIVNKF